MAGDKDVDAVGTDGLCHGPCTPCIAYFLGYFHIAPGFSVWNIKQCPPYPELEVRPDRVQRNIELLAGACKIFIQLPHGLLKDRRGLHAEISLHVPLNPTFVSFGTRHAVPVTQTQFIAHRCQNQFPTG